MHGPPMKMVKEFFEEKGLHFVDDELIPAELKRVGWSSEIYTKEIDRNTIYVLQVIIGPATDGARGEPVGRRKDAMVVKIKREGLWGRSRLFLIEEAEVDWANCEHDDPCQDLFSKL